MHTSLFCSKKSFQLELGGTLSELELTYTCYGELNKSQDNVIWIVHALTGNSQAAEWWSGLVGEGRFFDPSRYFIICANLPGSCYGSTSPLSINPDTGSAYYYNFPEITTRDMAAALELLRVQLKLDRIHTLLGGSLGGQVALEWALSLGTQLDHLVVLASAAKSSPWVVGFNEAQRMAIESDCTWGNRNPDAGSKGLETARAIAMLSYRYPVDFEKKQTSPPGTTDSFRAASYLRYQGSKLAKRFQAISYWYLSKAMDSHDIGRNRSSVENVLKKIQAKTVAVGVNTDLLFLPEESRFIAAHCPQAHYHEIQSTAGHDAFLIEFEQLQAILEKFYQE